MSSFIEPSRARSVSRLAIMAAFAAGLAGCSSDFSRFEGQHWAGKPQASNDVTGSVHAPAQAAPSHKVESSALPAPSYGGSAGIGQPSARQEVTGSVNSSSYPRQPAQQNWSWDGGTAIIVAQGETLDSIARRHGVPPHAILQANNMSPASHIQPGQRLVIPRVQHQMAAPQVTPPATRVAGPAPAPAGNGSHGVAPGDTIYSLGRRYHLTPMAIAKANNVGLDHHLKIGDRIAIPGQAAAPRLAMPGQQPPPVAQPAPRVAAKPQTPAPQSPTIQQPAPKMAQAKPAQPQVAQKEPAPTAN